MSKRFSMLALSVLLAGSGAAIAQTTVAPVPGAPATTRPIDNVGRRHPHMERAQHLVSNAYQQMMEAQQANEFDFGGHAQHAKELLDQANREIAAAASYRNTHPEANR